ncbi:hypothetical protein OESDEN_01278 [Oesophagostomum dentatum]|uniref:SWIM-type domain-containing protein n=1 Tax=Oesophagostomum dentatum TaxID=61180 RepID=A0A0B1TNB3_OESDE|nr:hypothetical protein OESDEN_01278 [Oesophagostomum dentatum]
MPPKPQRSKNADVASASKTASQMSLSTPGDCNGEDSSDYSKISTAELIKCVKELNKKPIIEQMLTAVAKKIHSDVADEIGAEKRSRTIVISGIEEHARALRASERAADLKAKNAANSTVRMMNEYREIPIHKPDKIVSKLRKEKWNMDKPDHLQDPFTTRSGIKYLEKYGGKGITIDDTFDITKYALRLATLHVVDDAGVGFPVAFLLSSKMSSKELAKLFLLIKKHEAKVVGSMFRNMLTKPLSTTKTHMPALLLGYHKEARHDELHGTDLFKQKKRAVRGTTAHFGRNSKNIGNHKQALLHYSGKPNNSHCDRCGVCAYRMQCACANSTQPGVACIHKHAVATFDTQVRALLPVQHKLATTSTSTVTLTKPPIPITFEEVIAEVYEDEQNTTTNVAQTTTPCISVEVNDEAMEQFRQLEETVARMYEVMRTALKCEKPEFIRIMRTTIEEKKKKPLKQRRESETSHANVERYLEIDRENLCSCFNCGKREPAQDGEGDILWFSCSNVKHCRAWTREQCSGGLGRKCQICGVGTWTEETVETSKQDTRQAKRKNVSANLHCVINNEWFMKQPLKQHKNQKILVLAIRQTLNVVRDVGENERPLAPELPGVAPRWGQRRRYLHKDALIALSTASAASRILLPCTSDSPSIRYCTQMTPYLGRH